jgi:hypothetical protein
MAREASQDQAIQAGDKVLLFKSHIHLSGHGKLHSKWEVPYLVLHAGDHVAITSSAMMGIHSRLMANALNDSMSQIPRILRKWMSSIYLSYNDYIHRFA